MIITLQVENMKCGDPDHYVRICILSIRLHSKELENVLVEAMKVLLS